MRLSPQYLDLLVATTLALLMLLIALVLPGFQSPIRTALGVLLLLLLPGYTLMVAIFPHRGDISSLKRLAISFGLSITVVPVVGLILTNTPWGIRLDSVTVALALAVVVAALVALGRRLVLAPERRFTPQSDPRFSRGLAFAALAVGTVITLAVAFQVRAPFTAIYLLGPEGQMEAFPNFLQPNEAFSVTVTVENRERRARTYQLDVRLEEEMASSLEIPRIPRGQDWQQAVALRAPDQPGRHRLTFELFRQGRPKAYRQVHLELTVVATATREAP